MNWSKLVPLSGVAAVACILGGFLVVGDTPDADAPVQEVVSFWTDHDSDGQFSGLLLSLGAFFFLIFSTTVAGLLRRAQGETGGSSALAFGGGVLFAAGGAIFAGIVFCLGDVAGDVGPGTLQTLNVMNEDMFFPIAVGVATFLLGSGIATVKTGALPKWLGWVAIVFGVLGVTPVGFVSFGVLGLWTLIVSVMLAMNADTA
jgi:hypothetical protein